MYSPRLIVPSAARTTNGNSGPVDALVGRAADTVAMQVIVTAASGTTPSMTLAVEWSLDGGTTWSPANPADAFTAITAAGNQLRMWEAKAPLYRVTWTITGTTPSFTFSIWEWPNAD